MSKLNEYRDFVKSIRSRVGYWKSYSLLQFTVSLTRIMHLDKVSGKKLASRLDISPAQVSKVLRGNENVTIETMAKFAAALDAAVHIHVAKKGVPVVWKELSAGQSAANDLETSAQSAGLEGSPVILTPSMPQPTGTRYVSASWLQ